MKPIVAHPEVKAPRQAARGCLADRLAAWRGFQPADENPRVASSHSLGMVGLTVAGAVVVSCVGALLRLIAKETELEDACAGSCGG